MFTPVKATTTSEHGKPQVETERYALQQSGRVLRLTTGNDVMEFHKQYGFIMRLNSWLSPSW